MSSRAKTGKNKTDEIFIPDKLYFRIGEVATLCRLPAYVLRFWESEFPQLKPVKSSTGQRMYRRRDVECVLRRRPKKGRPRFRFPRNHPRKCSASVRVCARF